MPEHEFFPAGRPVPPFTLTAIKSGRRVSPADCSGLPLGLVFHSRETVQAVIDINTAVRPRYPNPDQVTLVSVVDLSSTPRMLRSLITPFLERVYDEAASNVPDGYDPADYVFLLPDWDGAVTRTFGVAAPDKMAAIVVIDSAGIVVGSYQGPEPGPATLRLVEQALHNSG